ncbi:C40 family peptidase [Streptomyces indicus]|uniref:Cell wall-associated hydrolase, NlpC family n=1 Tax=Streptomyces indicus TaxID=417292 RepID=A0A1G9EEK4_9ACTN|nr:C40 family peptidase [Streptomyces indicus]SDK74590.1 Cell wall-associated hydrolase, NlpC family [Streptomyces indicus]
MASHRKPRTSRIRTSHAVGITSAALTSVALLAQTANAAPAEPDKPSLEEVQKKVDELYREAGTATQKYNLAKERSGQQREKLNDLQDEVAERTEKVNDARRELGQIAAAQYRNGSASDAAVLLLSDNPDDYFAQRQLMGQLSGRQHKAVEDFKTLQTQANDKRDEATDSLAQLTDTESELKTSKQDVQQKLGEARELLSKLTEEEKKRLAELERQREAEAKRKAEELARKQAAEEEAKRRAAEEAAKEEAAKEEAAEEPAEPPASGDGGADAGDSYAAKAEKVIAWAETQIGKPYVWGAAGPDSYDCSGLTQKAWAQAGISLPRTTWDQVKVGTTVTVENAKPGDLVFFYDDISHVGIYIGNGEMIHAPKPGANVRTESIYYMPIHSVVRPA